ncbi:MAG TPA: hypothetical protein VGD01_02655 [Candidatus Elarobacter sp.]
MFALGRSSRALVAASAFCSFAGAFVCAPLVVRGEGTIVPSAPLRPAPRETATPFRDVAPRRDPFEGGPLPLRHAATSGEPLPAAALAVPLAGSRDDIAGVLRPLPPNAGAAAAPFPFAVPPGASSPGATAATATVVAVATGRTPYALIQEAGTLRLVTLGDRLGPDTVVAIRADGVHLASGRALPLARESAAAQAPLRTAEPARAPSPSSGPPGSAPASNPPAPPFGTAAGRPPR